MSETKCLNLGGRPLPLSVEDLHGLPLSPGSSMKFDFNFRFIRFAALVELPLGTDHCVLKLAGDVGPLPYTAESPSARDGLKTIVNSANQSLGGRFKLAGGRVMLGGETQLDMALHATALVSAIAKMLIPAIPYLELIAHYVRPPLAPARRGESAVRPEWRKKA